MNQFESRNRRAFASAQQTWEDMMPPEDEDSAFGEDEDFQDTEGFEEDRDRTGEVE